MTGWHWALAVLAALAIGAGLIWWHDGVLPGLPSHKPDNNAQRATREQATPTLYRWVDAHGVVNITDRPPKSRRYTIVKIDPEQNIVPAGTADGN